MARRALAPAGVQLRLEVPAGTEQMRKLLLISGIFSSLLYVVMDIVASMSYDGYSYTSQTVSELIATGAPTRPAVASKKHM
jgi:hypothetical protein